ncbi:hypothetical protein LTR53_002054 [Teratosphaeriaceae sp. CCFEE 6253]|nr:hypothetical protein LTR53_002054 [Teratosphaeriaceae sp. CCFEE 6253]
MTIPERPWWKDSVVYQIYPASFKDSNGDGVGDLNGIRQSLDYIQSIGVDVIWICPMYASPQVDMGYDISDYTAVHPPYGTVEDMEVLIAETHQRGLRIILDLVVNHTSEQHAWFQDSRSSRDSAKRDWYIWKPAKYDSKGNRRPPNNWRSNFGGTVWEWDEHTQEYYLHLFCAEQPDLNWANTEARQAIYRDAMIFWLEKGIDGFRVDTVNMYSKDPAFPDAPVTDPTADWQMAGTVFCNGPQMNEILSEMNAILSRYNAMSVGECPFTPELSTVLDYVGAGSKRLNMVFQFDVVDVGQGSVFKYQTTPFAYKLQDLKRAVDRTQSLITGTDGWATSFVENHDQARSVSRFGDDSPQWRERSAKMLALLFGSLSGTLFVYQGQELGMINMPPDWPIEEYKDVDTINYYRMVEERSGSDPAELSSAHAALQHLARDHARTPMQWTAAAPNAGFTDEGVVPWMRANTSAKQINVRDQVARKDSPFAFWRRVLLMRRQYNAFLVHGEFELVDAEDEQVFSFVKRSGERSVLVTCNFSSKRGALPKILNGCRKVNVLLSNVETHHDDLLEPWEGRVCLLD